MLENTANRIADIDTDANKPDCSTIVPASTAQPRRRRVRQEPRKNRGRQSHHRAQRETAPAQDTGHSADQPSPRSRPTGTGTVHPPGADVEPAAADPAGPREQEPR